MQIADLTGNVPLALAVVGAIFKFPDAPTPEEVIEGLKENLVGTLSPAELHSKVDVSISVAYHYLTPELKELCVNLSHFPGSFDKTSAVAIFDFRENMPEMLVQRSLLQYERNVRRFHFHLLLKTFFLRVNDEEAGKRLQYYFNDTFLLYFAQVLHTAIPDNGIISDSFHGKTLDNVAYMLILLMHHKNVNTTYFAIKVLSHELRMNIIMHFIHPDLFLIMLECLDSYTPEERNSVESFLGTYIQVVTVVTKGDLKSSTSLILIASKKKEVDRGYEQGTLTLSTFVKYFIMLGEIYKMNGYEKNWRRCHAHILTKTKDKLQDCYPPCDYFSISIAYETIGDKVQAFHFRKLAYDHQLLIDLTPMNMIKLQLFLYSDYSNTSLGNDVTEAKLLSLLISAYYSILMNADRHEYSEEVYYAAIEFFQGQNMEDNAIQLQKKIIESTFLCDESNCMLTSLKSSTLCNLDCALIYGEFAVKAYKRHCYYIAIWSGQKCFNYSGKLGEEYDGLGCASSFIVNPRRACAARVTVVALCVCVCVFVCPGRSSATHATKRQTRRT